MDLSMEYIAEEKHGFRGNINIKKTNVPIQWTPELICELKKCKDDVIYFVENYCKIVSLDKGIVPFKLYPFQKKLLNLCSENRFVIDMQSRQSGKSITSAAYLLHMVIFNENKFVAILANKVDSAREIMSRIQLMFELLPKWMQQGVVDWNKGSFHLENGSKIIASSTSSSAIRGKSVNCLLLDEFAFVPKGIADDFMTSVYPTISSGSTSQIIITSTPYGMNHFYKLWSEAVRKKNEYVYMEVPWNEVPGRDEKWKEETLKNIGEEAFTQEFDIKFVGSAGTLITPNFLREMVYDKPKSTIDSLNIYKDPIQGHAYCMTVDGSEGVGKDFTCISVFDITQLPYEHVAIFRNNDIDPHLIPDIVYSLSTRYNNAMTLVELNSTGLLIASILVNELEFENLLWVSNYGTKGQRISNYGGKSQMGIKTSVITKKVGCAVLKSLIENKQLIVHDYDTIQELFTFIRVGQTYRAQEGNNDDTVATLFLFAWMTKQTEFENIAIPETDGRDMSIFNLRGHIHSDSYDLITETLSPMPIIDDNTSIDYQERSREFHSPEAGMQSFFP